MNQKPQAAIFFPYRVHLTSSRKPREQHKGALRRNFVELWHQSGSRLVRYRTAFTGKLIIEMRLRTEEIVAQSKKHEGQDGRQT